MTPSNKYAIALLSSGLDSSIALAIALSEGYRMAKALTFDYGQRAAQQEIGHAAKIAAHFGIPHQVIALPWFQEFKKTGLLSSNEALPSPSVAQLSERDYSLNSAARVWVPNRNGVFIEVAAGIAENHGADQILVGFNAEEAATFPDNSIDYLDAITRALSYSTSNQVQVLSPTAGLQKKEIVDRGRHLNFPFELLWSCYEKEEKMCGRCESCMRLKRALHLNDMKWEGLFDHLSLS